MSDPAEPAAGSGSAQGGRWKVPLFDLHLDEDEIATVAETYRSGWLTMGPRTAELERAFAEYAGVGHAVALSSGTAALHLALLAAGIGPDDSVLVPSITFVATANAVAYVGARPRFIEIAGLGRPWLSAEAAEQELRSGASAILNVAYGGHLGETAALVELADRHGVPLIEDAAHAAGSWHEGRHAGTFGSAGAISFFSNKNLGVGEGGILLTDEEAIADHARALRSHGVTAGSWLGHQRPGMGYDVGELGFNYRIDEPRATLARLRLDRLDEQNRQRGELDSYYRRELKGLAGLSPVERPPLEEKRWSCHLFAVVLDEGVDRDAFRRSLAGAGVETSVHYPAIHTLELYREPRRELPLSEAYAARTVSLPMFPGIEPWQSQLVVEAVTAALAEASGG